ncbi:peptidase A24A prepilin type IV [Dinoroseobacter shibae DFL 12 = DSM 16493]|jgi:prepilin peptidase CpaA|uniref:Peptidase A24A prepilin type IV n=1 Tax=Dinoroseobacter shibae (strain DSM 16493 / NCIMB 14021 / DFL 12) TaxID=398580 RepID=A8LHR6_DINSH|nr:prepilin peptidase [Dinoroseobacter shibae]ABV92863.1 peptidase A24A prepilin type IV [Dinoroseobacter shibae DFL 12 = DSM 16493]URF47799.1 prepilin peptidase [Dinoroseobacter shibae]URF52109.1 prepilin peptidase [Dinoroseobacter shibae]
MAVTVSQALWFLPFILPICLFVAWSDMKFMRIPNRSVLLLLGMFAIVGLLALPLLDYAWRWVHVIAVLAVGFVMSSAGLVGAGDAKFAAAMAPFVALQDALLVVVLFSAILLGAFATHRLARMLPAVRRLTPDWESWTRKRDFPMGLALSGTLIFYFLLPVLLPQVTLS